MGSLFGGGMPDTSAQDKKLADQEKKLATQEKMQANELAARRRMASAGSKSKTLFSSVEGMAKSATAKKTTLGG